MPNEKSKLCPSASCRQGSSLLGIVERDKKVTLLDTPVKISDTFIRKVNEYGTPEKHFRFANKCVKGGCKQWTGNSCGVMDTLSSMNPAVGADEEQLPNCFIRHTCRWYDQDGGKACKICLFVVTDSLSED